MAEIKSRKNLLAVLGISATITLAACGSSGNASTGNSSSGTRLSTITVASDAANAGLPILVASQRNYFKDNGLKVNFVKVGNIGKLLEGVPQSYDIVLSTDTLLLSARAQGLDLMQIAGSVNDTRQNPQVSLLVKSGSGIHSVRQLSGKTVGVLSVSGTINLATEYWLQQSGVSPTSVKFIQIPLGEEQAQLAAGRVAAVESSPPFQESIIKAGATNLGDPMLHVASSMSLVDWVANAKWAQTHKSQVQGFQRALGRADAYIQKHPQAALRLDEQLTGLPSALLKGAPLPTFTVAQNPADFSLWAHVMKSVNGFSYKPQLKDLVWQG